MGIANPARSRQACLVTEAYSSRMDCETMQPLTGLASEKHSDPLDGQGIIGRPISMPSINTCEGQFKGQ